MNVNKEEKESYDSIKRRECAFLYRERTPDGGIAHCCIHENPDKDVHTHICLLEISDEGPIIPEACNRCKKSVPCPKKIDRSICFHEYYDVYPPVSHEYPTLKVCRICGHTESVEARHSLLEEPKTKSTDDVLESIADAIENLADRVADLDFKITELAEYIINFRESVEQFVNCSDDGVIEKEDEELMFNWDSYNQNYFFSLQDVHTIIFDTTNLAIRLIDNDNSYLFTLFEPDKYELLYQLELFREEHDLDFKIILGNVSTAYTKIQRRPDDEH